MYHAEHFRPKGRVKFRVEGEKTLRCAVAVDEDGKQIEHPRYFWLAYNWANLLPSCHHCNSALGKNDQFPISGSYIAIRRLTATEVAKLHRKEIRSAVQNDVYYLQPENLDEFEHPLLINPYFSDPSDHLVFGDRGIVAAKDGSLQGATSIQVYNLGNEGGYASIARRPRRLHSKPIPTNSYAARVCPVKIASITQKMP